MGSYNEDIYKEQIDVFNEIIVDFADKCISSNLDPKIVLIELISASFSLAMSMADSDMEKAIIIFDSISNEIKQQKYYKENHDGLQDIKWKHRTNNRSVK